MLCADFCRGGGTDHFESLSQPYDREYVLRSKRIRILILILIHNIVKVIFQSLQYTYILYSVSWLVLSGPLQDLHPGNLPISSSL